MKLMKIFGMTAVMLLMPFVSKAEMDSTAEEAPMMTQEMQENLAMLNAVYPAIGIYNVYGLDVETLTAVNEAFQNDIGHYDNKRENYAAVSETDTFKLYLAFGAIGKMVMESSGGKMNMMDVNNMPEAVRSYINTILSEVLTSQAPLEYRLSLASFLSLTVMYSLMKDQFAGEVLEAAAKSIYTNLSKAIKDTATTAVASVRRTKIAQMLCNAVKADESMSNAYGIRNPEETSCENVEDGLLGSLSGVDEIAWNAAGMDE